MTLKTISLGKYPYTYARVSVMRSSLLSKEDYHKLLKMSLSEITSFLQASQYKKAIDELAARHSGVELMEMALNRNLVETWQKLKKISKKEVSILIEAYLQRADLWNIKTILRSLHTGTKAETTAAMLLPAGKLSRKELEELIKSESVEEALKKLGAGIKQEAIAHAIEQYKAKNTLVDVENHLDRQYYSSLIEFSRKIPSEGKLFRQFLEAEIEVINAMNILRLRKAGVEKHEAAKYMIGKPSLFVQNLIKAESKEETAKLLKERVPDSAAESFISANTLAETELELGKSLLKRTRVLLHQHPLTVDVILGYMFAKEIEVKNLKLLLKARQLSLSSEFVEQQLVV